MKEQAPRPSSAKQSNNQETVIDTILSISSSKKQHSPPSSHSHHHPMLNTLSSPPANSASNAASIRRIATLEAKVYQHETESIAAVAARRRAEQELAAVKAELAAFGKSSSARQLDHERAIEFCRDQLRSKTAEAALMEDQCKKLSSDLEHVRSDFHRHQDESNNKERKYKEQLARAEQEIEQLNNRLHVSENHEKSFQAARQAMIHSQSAIELECSALKEELIKSKENVELLKKELLAAKNQLESVYCCEKRGIIAEETLHEALSQRAALAQECRGLRSEVGRLSNALLDDKNAVEREKHVQEQKMSSIIHQLHAAKCSLEAKKDSLVAADSQIAALHAEMDRTKDVHAIEVASLKDKVRQIKKELEESKKKCEQEAEHTRHQHDDAVRAAVQSAVLSHQKRIQDLELQLTHQQFVLRHASACGCCKGLGKGTGCSGGPVAVMATAAAAASCSQQHHGSFASSVLEYMPRSEHVRLMEIKLAAREGEVCQQIQEEREKILKECQIKLDCLTQELDHLRVQLEGKVKEALDYKDEAQRAQHEVALLRTTCNELQNKVCMAQNDTEQLSNALQKAMKENESKHAQHDAAMAELCCENHRVNQALSKSISDHRAMEETVSSVQSEILSAQRALHDARKDSTDLHAALDRATRCIRAHEEENQRARRGLDASRVKYAELEQQHGSLQQQCTELRCRMADIQGRMKSMEISACRFISRLEESLELNNSDGDLKAADDQYRGRKKAAAGGVENGMNNTKQPAKRIKVLPTRDGSSCSTMDARMKIILGRCNELQTKAATLTLAQQEIERLTAGLVAEHTAHEALEKEYEAVQQQYMQEMSVLEAAARKHIEGISTQAHEAISGIKKASTCLEESLVTRAHTLAEEVAELRAKLAQQKEGADKVEQSEQEMHALIEKLNAGAFGSLNNNNNTKD